MKRFWASYLSTFLLVFVFFGLVLWFLFPLFNHSRLRIVSPLPSFLSLTKNSEVSTLDLFLPSLDEIMAFDNLSIHAKSALSYDLTTNQVLFSKNPKEKLPFASLTKIMTAIVAIENKKEDDEYYVKKEDLVVENSMGLTAGEALSLKELLYGLVLLSGNDAAEVLAGNYPGGREKFIEAMNNKAKALGLLETHFTNPTGLEGDGDQYSTSYDLFVITNYALSKYPLFAEVAQTVEQNIHQTDTHKAFYLYNETNLLTSYPGVKGVKTGYTPEAGLCLVTYLEYEGHKIIGVLLGSDNRRADMKSILDYSLRKINIVPPEHN